LVNKLSKYKVIGLTLSLAMLVTACSEVISDQSAPYSHAANIATITAQMSNVTLYDELQGRVRPLRSAEIRPQVSGIITQRLFRQGDTLKQGDALFQIDPQAFEIDIDIKQASLLQSQANLALLQSQLARLITLDRTQAVSKQAIEETRFNTDIAAATVQQNQAQLEHSQLQLQYARVTAPISGFIGEAMVTEGALVGRDDTQPLAVIQQIDKVYVDVRQPASKLSQLRHQLKSSQEKTEKELTVTVRYSPNSMDDVTGKILFSGISVDENTGDLIVRILADNPQQNLLPGMYVRTQIPRQQLQAIRIPEQAVKRSSSGEPYAFVVIDGKFEQRMLNIEGIQNGDYIVSQGLKKDDVVVVTGQENLQQGAQLTLSTWLK
jgi:multidrug efflux system membrane fusion protein